MYKACASCLLAIAVLVIVITLVWRTVKQESARPTGPVVGTLSYGQGSKQPVKAFTTTELLGDYLLAAADRNTAAAARICNSPGAMSLPAGTKAIFEGISGPGQARVKIVSGEHKDQIVYVNFAAIIVPSQGSGS